MTKQGKIVNESQDQKYFTITPRLIWALSRNTYDYTLWSVVKGIAGDSGECYLDTDQLAALAMMSKGQASESREYWIKIGLLGGGMRKDPGYPQAVYHLSVPNVWKENLEWAEKYPGIKERVEFKKKQKELVEEERRKKRENQRVHQVNPPENAEKGSPGEHKGSPGEPKNIHLRKTIKPLEADASEPTPANINPNSGRRTDAKVLGDPMAGILFFAKQAEDVNAELENRVNDYPSDCHRTLRLLVEIFGWLPASIPAKPARGGKGGAYAQWINEIREIDQGVGSFGQDGIRFVANACKDLTVSHPGAITWAIAGEIGKYARKQAFVAMSAPKPIDTPYTRAIENPSVISPENEAKLAAFRKRLRAQS